MSSCTNGKWTLDTHDGNVRADRQLIAQVYGATVHNHEANADECFKNARLIVAAPEMYALMERVAYGNCDDCLPLMVSAREILARIDGEESQYGD